MRQAIEKADRPLSPEELLGLAKAECEGLSIATVYRNIKALVGEGWLTAVELPGKPPRYEVAGKGHHHHFHCNGCGQVYELPGCVGSFQAMTPRGFKVTSHEVLLYGLCQRCRRTAGAA